MSKGGPSRTARGLSLLPAHRRCEVPSCNDQRSFRALLISGGDAFALEVCGQHANGYRDAIGPNIIAYRDGPAHTVISVTPINRKR